MIAAIALMLIAAIGFGWSWHRERKESSFSQNTINCIGADSASFNCWEARYGQMVADDSPKVAFADMKSKYETDDFMRTNCHQLSHVIGRAAGAKYQDVGEAYTQGDNFCWSGYYHGVIEEISEKLGDGLIPQLNSICDGPKKENQYSFFHYNCVHGLGHGLMVIEGAELFVALKGCDHLVDQWERTSCHGGVFMENIMNSQNPDHHTEYIKQDDPMYPCTAVDEVYKEQCYLMQTSHALTVVGRDFSKVFQLCATSAGGHEATCYQSVGRDASGSTASDQVKTRELCMLGHSVDARRNCVIGAVKDFISYHHSDIQAQKFCESLDIAYKQTCSQTAHEYYQTF